MIRRARRAGWVTVAVAVTAVTLGPLLGGCTSGLSSPGAPTAGLGSSTSAVGDHSVARAQHLNEQIGRVLAGQASALLTRNEADFVAPAGTDAAHAALRRQYRNLVALRIVGFQFVPEFPSEDFRTGDWSTTVEVRFCFVVAYCITDSVVELMTWQDTPRGPVLMSVTPKPTAGRYPVAQPWQLSDLHVLVGPRTLVATTSRYKHRLPAVLEVAEKAAKVADTFAIGYLPSTYPQRPDLYRIYLAGDNEWHTWYGGQQPGWVAGYSASISYRRADVVLNNASLPADPLPMLRHELTHAASAYGIFQWSDSWWLVEGIATLAENPTGLEPGWAGATRRYIRQDWDRKLGAYGPGAKTPAETVGAMYGVAFLAVQCLDRRFGRAKLMTFFRLAFREARGYQPSAEQAFDTEWASVRASCVDYIMNWATS